LSSAAASGILGERLEEIAMRLPVLLLLLGLIGLIGLSPSIAAPPKAEMSAAEASATRLALERGRLIYAYDQAAWHGTDDLVKKLPDYPSRVSGWIVDGPADAPHLVFYDKDDTDPHAVYVADFRGTELSSSRVLGPADDRSLSPARKAMIAARRAAVEALAAAKVRACKDQPFNTVVLPPSAPGDPTLVYILTPQTDPKAVPMGGHYRVEVAGDGRAGKPRKFTNACMEMPFADERGRRPVALGITHLLDPTPTEIHVFTSLATGLPIFVGTKDGRMWTVDGNGIALAAAGSGR
jgi:hypothetical protein